MVVIAARHDNAAVCCAASDNLGSLAHEGLVVCSNYLWAADTVQLLQVTAHPDRSRTIALRLLQLASDLLLHCATFSGAVSVPVCLSSHLFRRLGRSPLRLAASLPLGQSNLAQSATLGLGRQVVAVQDGSLVGGLSSGDSCRADLQLVSAVTQAGWLRSWCVDKPLSDLGT